MRNRLRLAFPTTLVMLLFLAATVLGTCTVDENYHLFVQDDYPAKFEVIVSNTNFSGISICRLDDEDSGLQPMGLQLRGLNSDGTIDVSYNRTVKISLVGDNGSVVATAPSRSPVFVEGEATVDSLTIAGTIDEGVEYSVHVEDVENSSSHGQSDPPFLIDVLRLDHFEVQGIPAIIQPYTDTSFPLSVYAFDQNGGYYPDFDGLVHLSITDGWTITPNQLRFAAGSTAASESVTINGSGTFEISATVAEDQPEDVTCLGGVEAGGGGGGGGGSGGSDEPGELSCTLTASPTSMLRGQPFTLTLQISKLTDEGERYNSFSGTANFEATYAPDYTGGSGSVTIDPSSAQTLDRLSSSHYPITIPNTTGEFEVTANVADAESTLSCSCTTEVSARDAVGVFGSFASTIAEFLTDAISGTSFERVESNTISSLDDINAYTALIVSMPGSDYGSDRYDNAGFPTRDLTAAEAVILNEYYAAGNPIFVAHDTMPTDVVEALDADSSGGDLWGLASATQITFNRDDPSAVPFTLTQQSPWNTNGATVTPFKETYCDGFTLSGGAPGVTVVSATYQGTNYALMVSTPDSTSPRAVIAGESIYHTHGGQSQTDDTVSPETQWWEEGEQLVINVVNWLLGS